MSDQSVVGYSYVVSPDGETRADGDDVVLISALKPGKIRIDIANVPKPGENTVVEFALDDFMRAIGRALIDAEGT